MSAILKDLRAAFGDVEAAPYTVVVERGSIINNGEEEGVDFSRYYVAGYDPPFKLLGRRNEVWVVKKVSENRLNGCNGSEVSLNGVLMKEEQLGDDMVQLVTENGNDEVMLS
ncbi:Heme-binding protein 1 [Portunus trituberculatus]|uniref:Heme-binding protein 1 n=1 Tax=Portunus trituberculatus TaxID=210409 RepID=A0A5B7CQW7_PORTR|nr:Heme-binding protein 1 [Portunus trituberculatus]